MTPKTSCTLFSLLQVLSDHCLLPLCCLQVELSVEQSSFHLLVDRFRVTDGRLPDNEGSSLELLNPVYLGGDPGGRNTKVCSAPVRPSSCFCLSPLLQPLCSPPPGPQCSHEQCDRLHTQLQDERGYSVGGGVQLRHLALLRQACRDRELLRRWLHFLRFVHSHAP